MKYKKIITHYRECFKRHGDTALGMDWPDESEIDVRHEVMHQLMRESGTILDFGCGTSHYQEWVQNGVISKSQHPYTGLDLDAGKIATCKTKFPQHNFLCQDILEVPLEKSYDYIMMNGVFTEKLDLSNDEMTEYFEALLTAAWNSCNKGLAFNVMSKNVDWERDDLFHLPMDYLGTFLSKNLKDCCHASKITMSITRIKVTAMYQD